ncbi:MAG: hypothetical protein J5J06_17985 [Phycisphaerae bacterium]|nr:hypothetical protein [Phycisphaerae bacterium]
MTAIVARSLLALLSGAAALDGDIHWTGTPGTAVFCAREAALAHSLAPVFVVDWSVTMPPAAELAPPAIVHGNIVRVLPPEDHFLARFLRPTRIGSRFGP